MLALHLKFYSFPECRQSKCKGINDYDWYLGTLFGWMALKWHYYICNCGDQYVRKGKEFMILEEDGLHAYKILSGNREWVDDEPLNEIKDYESW